MYEPEEKNMKFHGYINFIETSVRSLTQIDSRIRGIILNRVPKKETFLPSGHNNKNKGGNGNGVYHI
jgi:hypothetical protein